MSCGVCRRGGHCGGGRLDDKGVMKFGRKQSIGRRGMSNVRVLMRCREKSGLIVTCGRFGRYLDGTLFRHAAI